MDFNDKQKEIIINYFDKCKNKEELIALINNSHLTNEGAYDILSSKNLAEDISIIGKLNKKCFTKEFIDENINELDMLTMIKNGTIPTELIEKYEDRITDECWKYMDGYYYCSQKEWGEFSEDFIKRNIDKFKNMEFFASSKLSEEFLIENKQYIHWRLQIFLMDKNKITEEFLGKVIDSFETCDLPIILEEIIDSSDKEQSKKVLKYITRIETDYCQYLFTNLKTRKLIPYFNEEISIKALHWMGLPLEMVNNINKERLKELKTLKFLDKKFIETNRDYFDSVVYGKYLAENMDSEVFNYITTSFNSGNKLKNILTDGYPKVL